jgi:hypothetical protein
MSLFASERDRAQFSRRARISTMERKKEFTACFLIAIASLLISQLIDFPGTITEEIEDG